MSITPKLPAFYSSLEGADPEVAAALLNELDRQRNKIELIASENFTSLNVIKAQGTWLTNKYAEGLPGKRYYGGCEYVDDVERLAINRAKELFGADHVNVQPHSGAQANSAVYLALLQTGDRVMGMDLSHGGHLSHGSPVNSSGILYKFKSYGVTKENQTIDYDQLEKDAIEYQPKMIVGGASAYPRIIDFERMSAIAKKVGALLMIDMAHIAGLVAAGVHPSPVPFADVVTTTTHKTLRGPRGGMILCQEKYAAAINKAVFPGSQGGPLMHVIAAKAVALKEALAPEFKDYQVQVVENAATLAARLKTHDFTLVSGGTDNHLMLVDLRNKGITGKTLEHALDEIGITVNKNTVPYETESPFVTSGIRIGTPAVTARGMDESAMTDIADMIHDTVEALRNGQTPDGIADRVQTLSDRFPLYPDLR